MNCPDSQCKEILTEKIDKARLTLYGAEGTGGIVSCVKQKLSKKMAIVIILSILPFLGTPLGIGIKMAYTNKDKLAEAKTERSLIKKDVERINEKMEELKNEVRSTMSEGIRLIREDLKNINNSNGGKK